MTAELTQPWAQGTHPATHPLKGSLESTSQPWKPGWELLQDEGTVRVKGRGTGWDVPVTPHRTPGGKAAPEPGGPRTAEHGSCHMEKQLPSGTTAALGDRRGQLLWPQGYLSTRHRLGQTGPTDHILTGDVELDGSASHQLQP